MKHSKFDRVSVGLKRLGIDPILFEAIDMVMKSIMENEEQVGDTGEIEPDSAQGMVSATETKQPKFPRDGFNVIMLSKAYSNGKESLSRYLSRYAGDMNLEDYAMACAEKDKEFFDKEYEEDEEKNEKKKNDIDEIVENIITGKTQEKKKAEGGDEPEISEKNTEETTDQKQIENDRKFEDIVGHDNTDIVDIPKKSEEVHTPVLRYVKKKLQPYVNALESDNDEIKTIIADPEMKGKRLDGWLIHCNELLGELEKGLRDLVPNENKFKKVNVSIYDLYNNAVNDAEKNGITVGEYIKCAKEFDEEEFNKYKSIINILARTYRDYPVSSENKEVERAHKNNIEDLNKYIEQINKMFDDMYENLYNHMSTEYAKSMEDLLNNGGPEVIISAYKAGISPFRFIWEIYNNDACQENKEAGSQEDKEARNPEKEKEEAKRKRVMLLNDIMNKFEKYVDEQGYTMYKFYKADPEYGGKINKELKELGNAAIREEKKQEENIYGAKKEQKYDVITDYYYNVSHLIGDTKAFGYGDNVYEYLFYRLKHYKEPVSYKTIGRIIVNAENATQKKCSSECVEKINKYIHENYKEFQGNLADYINELRKSRPRDIELDKNGGNIEKIYDKLKNSSNMGVGISMLEPLSKCVEIDAKAIMQPMKELRKAAGMVMSKIGEDEPGALYKKKVNLFVDDGAIKTNALPDIEKIDLNKDGKNIERLCNMSKEDIVNAAKKIKMPVYKYILANILYDVEEIEKQIKSSREKMNSMLRFILSRLGTSSLETEKDNEYYNKLQEYILQTDSNTPATSTSSLSDEEKKTVSDLLTDAEESGTPVYEYIFEKLRSGEYHIGKDDPSNQYNEIEYLHKLFRNIMPEIDKNVDLDDLTDSENKYRIMIYHRIKSMSEPGVDEIHRRSILNKFDQLNKKFEMEPDELSAQKEKLDERIRAFEERRKQRQEEEKRKREENNAATAATAATDTTSSETTDTKKKKEHKRLKNPTVSTSGRIRI